MIPALFPIIKDCLDRFNEDKCGLPLNPSIPILWFGDVDKYMMSGKRILTIAINPSDREFDLEPKTGLYKYFPSLTSDIPNFGKGIPYPLTQPFFDKYYEAMCEYFNHPYSWFTYFEKVLNEFETTYGGKLDLAQSSKNTAIHIDFYAPVATCKKWRDLNAKEKGTINSNYGIYFVKLINVLKPDVIIMSVNAQAKQAILSSFGNANWKKSQTILTKGITGVSTFAYDGYEDLTGTAPIVINGRNFRGQPFGGINAVETMTVCKYFRQQLHI